MMRMNDLIDWMQKLRDKLLAKSKNKATPLTVPEKNAIDIINENNQLFDMTNARDSKRVESVYKEVNDALAGKPRVAKPAPSQPPKDPIADIYNRRQEIIARAGNDPEKLKSELKQELAKLNVDPADMLARLTGESRLTEPLRSIIKDEYNAAVKAFFAERTAREKLTANDTNNNLTQNQKAQDFLHLKKQLQYVDSAIKLDKQMGYGHADGEKGLLAIREKVVSRLQMVYFNKAPLLDSSSEQQAAPPKQQPSITLAQAEKQLREAQRFFPDDVKNAQKLVDQLKAAEQSKNGPVREQQKEVTSPAPVRPAQPLPKDAISLGEAERQLRDAQKFFPADVKNAQKLVDRIQGGEVVTREQLRREQEHEAHKHVKLAAPPPNKVLPTPGGKPLPIPGGHKTMPTKPDDNADSADKPTAPRRRN